jgi:hypothetical protein
MKRIPGRHMRKNDYKAKAFMKEDKKNLEGINKKAPQRKRQRAQSLTTHKEWCLD